MFEIEFITKLVHKNSLFLHFQKIEKMSLTEQEIIRREKLQKLTDMGINAFPAEEYKVTHTTQSIKKNFEEGKR